MSTGPVILRFNDELLRDMPHTKEEFIDVLADARLLHEQYCRDHENSSGQTGRSAPFRDISVGGSRWPGFRSMTS